MSKRKIKALEENKTALQEQIKQIESKIAALKKNQRWKCPRCSQKTTISKLDIVHLHLAKFDGNYHYYSEVRDYKVCCPKCLKPTRFYNTGYPGYEFIRGSIEFFGGRIDQYGNDNLWLNEVAEYKYPKSVQLGKTITINHYKDWINEPRPIG